MKTVEAAMRSVRAGSVALLYARIGLCATTGSAATVMATTEPFRLSIKHDGILPPYRSPCRIQTAKGKE